MQGLWITMAMVAVQFLEVGLNTLVKAATSNGMSQFVFILYSNALALFFLLPSTFLYHRKKAPPPISVSIICRMFLVGLLSCTVQTLMYTGIELSSPTVSSAMVDLVPAFTFILAIVSRMESLDLRLRSSQAKAVGTVVSIGGALMVTLYKGLPITIWSLPQKPITIWSLSQKLMSGISLSLSHQSNWLFGGFLLALAALSLSLLCVVQTWILKDYPAELMVTTICCSFVVILSAIVALVAEQNPKAWILRPDMELIAIFYSAIFLVSMRSVVHAWAFRKKGPIYVAIFNPLGMVIAIGMGVIFLEDNLYLGSMIGAVTVAIGFYAVMWGLVQEEKKVHEKRNQICGSVSSSAAPLLQNKSIDV